MCTFVLCLSLCVHVDIAVYVVGQLQGGDSFPNANRGLHCEWELVTASNWQKVQGADKVLAPPHLSHLPVYASILFLPPPLHRLISKRHVGAAIHPPAAALVALVVSWG